VDAALGEVLLHFVETQKLTEVAVGAQGLLQSLVFPLVLYGLNESG
jgi:hypothetical protein